jgi:hypothetical protein
MGNRTMDRVVANFRAAPSEQLAAWANVDRGGPNFSEFRGRVARVLNTAGFRVSIVGTSGIWTGRRVEQLFLDRNNADLCKEITAWAAAQPT